MLARKFVFFFQLSCILFRVLRCWCV
jgi:hypothetical protein